MMTATDDRGCFVVDAIRATNIGRESVVGGGGNKKIDKSANRTTERPPETGECMNSSRVI